jgi:hypothetical protein
VDYQVVAVTLRDGRVIKDVAIVHHSLIGEVRGYADIPFDPVDITHMEVTDKKWDVRRATQKKIAPPSNQSMKPSSVNQ